MDNKEYRHPEWDELPHDVVEFMQQVLAELQSEYTRIRERTIEDPGTAGDEGEENWADLFRAWLPATYNIVTKGRIITSLGEASPQIDVLILHPDYPKKLRNKKHYFSSGVIAAFECKNTLRRQGIKQAIENSKLIANMLDREQNKKGYWEKPKLTDLVYPELHKPIIYGLLAHSHNWSIGSARETINAAIFNLDTKITQHPREQLDIICVADTAVWSAGRCANTMDIEINRFLPICTSTFSCLHSGGWREDSVYHKSFTTIGALLSRLYQKLSHIDKNTLLFANYFKLATKDGRSGGRQQRLWGELLSQDARKSINLDEWRCYW